MTDADPRMTEPGHSLSRAPSPAGEGEMPGLVRTRDWAATPLGPRGRWPRSLRAAVDLILASPLGMAVLWGPGMIQIYNDGFRAIMGGKHPSGLGQPTFECWPEVRGFTAPIYEAVWRGEVRSFTDQPVTTFRHGSPEEAFFDLTYSPLRDGPGEGQPDGRVAGILVTVVEVTARVRGERLLRESEARFRAFVTASSDAIYRMSPDWSEMWELDGRGFLAGTAERSGGWLDRYIHPDDQPGVRAAIERAVRGRQPFDLEHRVRTADGSLGWTHSRAVPILDDGGRITEWLGAASDVTARREAEDALRGGEARSAFLVRLGDALRPLAEPAAIMGAACRLLAEQLDVDRAYYVEVDEAAGVARVERDFVRGGAPSLAGEHRVADFGWSVAVLRRGECLVIADTQASDLVPTADRPASAALRIIACMGTPLIKHGRLVGALCVTASRARSWTGTEVELLRDVGERLWAAVERAQAEAAMRESEERFRAFAENSADTIWIANRDGTRLEYLSPAFERTFGEPRTAVLADISRWSELLHPNDREEARTYMPRAAAGELVIVHYRIVRPSDGSTVWLRDTGFSIRDEAGAITRIAGIVQDITDIEKTSAELEEEKDRFRILAEGIPQLVWRSGDEGLWTWASPQWLAYTGQTQAETHDWGWLDVVHPDDHAAVRAAWHEARPHGELNLEYRIRRASDGTWRWHQTRSVPVRAAPTLEEPEGRIVEWLGTTNDIEDLKRLQGEQGVLVAELQHRTRNLLSVVRNVARRSVPPSPGRDQYDVRLAALGRVQGFLARSGRYTVPLGDLVEAELQAAGDGVSDRVTMEGPPVDLPGKGVQPVALALHELATNAVKYGAIAQPTGHLSITWRVEEREAGPRLLIDWRESGVEMPSGPPGRSGYGSELITRALPHQLKAETRLEFTPDGVRCSIALPADAFTTMEAVT